MMLFDSNIVLKSTKYKLESFDYQLFRRIVDDVFESLSSEELYYLTHVDMGSRAKNWCFTWNNYNDESISLIMSYENNPDFKYIIFGKEVGESNTPHLQGFVSYTNRRRFNQVQRDFPGCHLTITRMVSNAIEYCKKDGDFTELGEAPTTSGHRSDLEDFKNAVKEGCLDLELLRETYSEVYAKYPRFCLEYIEDNRPKKSIECHPLRDWQQDLNAVLNLTPDDRTIFFVVDLIGGKGKSWFAHYYASLHNNVQVLLPGKKADMAFTLKNDVRVLFLDAPRSKQGDFIQYDFLEDVKNGYVFSGKYESKMKILAKVHVVVNMNEYPDMSKLSRDRYNIINLN